MLDQAKVAAVAAAHKVLGHLKKNNIACKNRSSSDKSARASDDGDLFGPHDDEPSPLLEEGGRSDCGEAGFEEDAVAVDVREDDHGSPEPSGVEPDNAQGQQTSSLSSIANSRGVVNHWGREFGKVKN